MNCIRLLYFFDIMIFEFLTLICAAIATAIFYIRFKYRNFPPGPYGIPLMGYLPFLGQSPHKQYREIAKKFGKIFSICLGNLPIVILNDLDDIKKAFRSDTFSGRPKSVLAMEVISNGLTFNEGRAWSEQRKFTLRILRELGFGKSSMDELIREDVGNLIGHLRKQVGNPISFKRTLEISVINTLWSLVASEKHALDDPSIIELHKLSYEGFIELEVAGPVWFMPWLAKVAPNQTGYVNLLRAVENLRKFFRDLVMRRRKGFTSHNLRDFIDYYLQEIDKTTDPDSSFYGDNGIKNLVDLLINLFAAGSDTTSSTLCWGFLYLMHYPHVMKKIQEEIDSVVGRKELPIASDRFRMPYAEATVNEILRISSITSGGLLHSTTEATEFEGYYLPKGTIVMANLYNVNHNENYWKDPEIFRPERFLSSDGKFQKDDDGLLAFSTGKRICPAEHLAITNVFLNLTGILQNFNLKVCPDHPLPTLDAKPGLVLATQPYQLILCERKD